MTGGGGTPGRAGLAGGAAAPAGSAAGPAGAAAPAGPRLLVLSLALAVFMGRLDIYVVAVALPTVARDFHVGTGAVAWVTIGYLLFGTGSMLFVGRVAGRVGIRPLFVAGYAVFIAGALVCALSPSLGVLVAARCLQGLGGAVMTVTTYAAVSRLLPPSRMGATMGLLATAGALGVAVGSPLGGVLAATVSWRAAFFANVPVGIVAIVVAWRALPAAGCEPGRAPAAGARPRLDYAGGVLSFVALGALILFLDTGQTRGWVTWSSLALLAVAVVAAVLFVGRERRAAEPLLSPVLLRDRRVVLVAGACISGVVLMGGNSFLVPFYLELGKGMGTATAGLLLMTYSLAFMALSPFAGRLADRHSARAVSAAGMAVGAAACAFLALTADAPGYVPVVVFLLALAVTYSTFMPANSKAVLEAPPEEERGAGPALLGTLNSLGLLLGASLFKTAFAASVGRHDPTLARAMQGAGGSAGTGAAGAVVAHPDSPGWWFVGFSPAYTVGAIACGVALVLCLVAMHRRRAAASVPPGG